MEVMGTRLEHDLLGALLRGNHIHHEVIGHVTGGEFPTPVLGVIFDGIMHLLARGQHLSVATVSEHFPEWQARGVGIADPYVWDSGQVWVADAPRYADQIRAGYLRSTGDQIVTDLHLALRDGGKEPGQLLGQTARRLTDLVASTASTTFTERPLGDVLQTEDRYDWVIPALLERGDRLVVTGSEGGGKTTFLRQLAICAAGGLHPLSKTQMEPRRVTVLDTENTERQWRRTSRWIVNRVLQLGARRNPAEHVFLSTSARMDITRPGDLADVHRLLDRTDPEILMIGPLYRLVPRAITNDDDAAPVIAALDSIRDRGIALVMEAHAGKATDADGDRDMRPRGSSALLGWPEFGFGIRPLRDDPNVASLVRWRGDRDERDWPHHIYRGGDLPWTPSA